MCFVGNSLGGILGIKKLLILVACLRGTLADAVEFKRLASELDTDDGIGLKACGVDGLQENTELIGRW